MPLASGTIEVVSVRPIPNPSSIDAEYNYTHRYSFKIGEEWFSAGSVKSGNKVLVTKDGLPGIGPGAEVEFTYTKNGDFNNVKRSNISVVKASTLQETPQSEAKAAPKYQDSINPARIGQAINLAVETGMVKDLSELNDPATALRVAKALDDAHKAVAEAYKTLQGKPKAPQPPQVKNKPTPKANVPEEDLPF